MLEQSPHYEVSRRDRAVWKGLTWAPWLAPLILAIPLPAALLVAALIFSASGPAAISLFFLAIIGFAGGLGAGLITMLLLLFYRRNWSQRLRDKLAADGVTASELDWFTAELKSSERNALHELGEQNALLADAYRETLASRITATRLTETARRELVLVERRMNKLRYLKDADTSELRGELSADKVRLEALRREARERKTEAEARLQLIEAAARRGLSTGETNIALKRLKASREHVPYALEAARAEQEMRAEVERATHDLPPIDAPPLPTLAELEAMQAASEASNTEPAAAKVDSDLKKPATL